MDGGLSLGTGKISVHLYCTVSDPGMTSALGTEERYPLCTNFYVSCVFFMSNMNFGTIYLRFSSNIF